MSARASTPSSKPPSAEGPKSPEKSRINNLQKPPLRGSIPPKKPSTLPRSPPSASTRDRPKPPPTTTSAAKRPTSNATASTSSSARRTSTIPSSPKLSGHARTGSKVGSSKPEPRLGIKTGGSSRPSKDAENGTDQKALKGAKPAGEDVEKNDLTSIGQELGLKNAEIETLRQQVQQLQDHRMHEIEEIKNESEAARNADLIAQQELIKSKEQEMQEMVASVGNLKGQILTLQEEKAKDQANLAQRHEQALADKASRHQQELRDIIARNEDRAKDIRSRNAAELEEHSRAHQRQIEDSEALHKKEIQEMISQHEQKLRDESAVHEQEKEAIMSKHKQELGELSGHEKVSAEVVLRHEEELKGLQKTHARELEDADSRHAQQLKKAGGQHRQQLEEVYQEREQLHETVSKLRHEIGSVKTQHEQELDKLTSVHKGEKDISAGRLEALQQAVNRHQDQNREANQGYEQEVKQIKERYERQHEDAKVKHERQLEQELSSHSQKLADTVAKYEAKQRNTQAQLEAKIEEGSSLRSALEKADVERSSADSNLSLKHEDEMKAALAKHEKELGNVHDDKSALTQQLHVLRAAFEEANTANKHDLQVLDSQRKQELEDQAARYEQESQKRAAEHAQELAVAREEHQSAKADVGNLQAALQDLENLQTQNAEQAASAYERKSQELATKHEQSLKLLRDQHETAVFQATSLQTRLEAAEADKGQITQDLSHRSEQVLETLRKERDEALALKAKSDANQKLADFEKQDLLSNAQRLRRALDSKTREYDDLLAKQENVANQLTESKAALQATLEKSKLQDDGKANAMVTTYKEELKQVREQHMGAVKELAKSQQAIENLSQERDDTMKKAEAHMAAALKDLEEKHAQATKDLSAVHSKNLAQARDDHEATLSKLSALQTEQVTTIKSLETLKQRLAELESKAPAANNDQLHADLRNYMATLKRQYGTDAVDMEALKKDIDEEGGRREEGWRKQEEMRAVIAAELDKLLGDLV